MGGSIGKLLGTSSKKSSPPPAPEPTPAAPVKSSRTERMAAARRRARGAGYRGLLGGGRLGTGDAEERQTTLGVSS